jgi:hypothetical protein
MAVGALVGGGAGAATGAATKPSEVNLGKPPWTNPATRVPTPEGVSPNQATEQLNEQSLQAARHGQNAQ